MPVYLISHTVPLTPTQQDTIAQRVTDSHTEIFSAPSFFVNVRFSPASQFVGYVGRTRCDANSISAHVRHGPSRTPEMYEKLMRQLEGIWEAEVPESPDIRIFVMGDIVAGLEHGFVLPAAGEDKAWLEKHYDEFVKRGENGDRLMADLVEEIKGRGLVD